MLELVLAVAIIVVGLGAAIWGSRVAVRHASILAAGSRIPPFVIGITLIAIGTDLPEIANSVIAALAGHGDLVLGNAVGSTLAQVTLIFGLVPFLAGGFEVGRRPIGAIGIVTVIALLVGAVFVSDGRVSRFEGGVLAALWIVGSIAVWRFLPTSGEPELPLHRGILSHLAKAVGGLAVVGVGAGAAVSGMIDVAQTLQVSEYVVSFFGSSLGTSLPELVVAATALRRGEHELAIGDIFGASLSDASLSVGLGPLLAPVAVTAAVALRGSLLAVAVMCLVTGVLVYRQRHDRLSGTLFVLAYLAMFPLLLR